ncbi:MAG: plasmid pRiA4b ORF-3 family protein [Candidatus Heimdallarchaeota archaeon]|nr:plasmid pRiA4b ORF-3 family protein [Candidatus Heimdallarchaeota archaeon]
MLNQLKIELQDIQPKIWRRIQVNSDISLNELHHIIQISMGWKNSHLYTFTIDSIDYTVKEYDADFVKFADARNYNLEKLKIDGPFEYLYDFGDSWMHTIQIEKQIDVKRKINPMYLEGEGRCPPEDVGGTHGFEEFLAIIQNKSNPERDSYIEWYGSVFDPYMVNFKEINKKLANLDQYITQIESNYD